MTSNVGQNYPYSSETEADRAARDRRARRGEREDLGRQARRGDDAARRARPLVDLEVPDPGLPGHPPRRRLRARPARRVRRLRRDLRQDLPALSRTPRLPDDRRDDATSRLAPAARSRTRSGSWSRRAASGSSTGWRARGRLLAARGGGDEHARLRRRLAVRRGRLRVGGLLLVGDRPPHGLPQRAPPAVLGGPRAVPPRRSRWVRARHGPPADRRGVRAGDRPLPAHRPGRRARLLDRRDREHVHPVERRDARRRDDRRRRSPTRRGSGSTSSSRPRWAASPSGSSPAGASSSRPSPGRASASASRWRGTRRPGSSPAGSSGRWSGLLVPAADRGETAPLGPADSAERTRCRAAPRAGPSADDDPTARPMSTELVPLALLMFAVTYPFRALPLLTPGFDRLPARLRLPPPRRAGGPGGPRRGQHDGRRRRRRRAVVPRRPRVGRGRAVHRDRRLAAEPAARPGRGGRHRGHRAGAGLAALPA